ncbi:MAG: tRNA uridine-5-carboxymethylaminomethyl(34) synthesis GTPase MnmE [Pseudomonadota bacterium]
MIAAGPESQPIAALATGSGAAAVAVIRLSGHECHTMLLPCLNWRGVWQARQLRVATISDPHSGEHIDDTMVVLFAGPRSFTGEDSAEIHCHGGPYIVRRIMELLYRQGFRAAEPGEFTRRAFLNGKLDLTAAEGIKALVEAQSHQQWVAARHLTEGKLKSAIEDLRRLLVEALAYLAAQIDFPDEGDTAHVDLVPVRQRVSQAANAIKGLIGSYDDGRVASQGLTVALFGAPNAGKSTLMNTLLGRERAIVTAIAGTTRDYLEESCLIDGRLIRLIDMAGVRDSTDPVEAMGVEKARQLAREADLVLFLVSSDQQDSPESQLSKWIGELNPRAHLLVATKADLRPAPWTAARDWLRISCHDGTGIKDLGAALANQVDLHVGNLAAEHAYVTSARQHHSLRNALEGLDKFRSADADGAYVELLAFELQESVKALRGIVGEIDTEDVLDKVFSQFCVGK